MVIEQALYGEVHGGHGLRLASSTFPVISELTSRLDLPDTAPPGVDWSPFLSGFPHGEHYVLARTFSDPVARRSGMVLTHAVIAPLDEVIALSDLRKLFALLITEPSPPKELVKSEFLESGVPARSTLDLAPLAEALVTRGAGPVVRVGLPGFDELVLALWTYLWPEIRAQFAFRMSFGPQDIIDTPQPALICTPKELAGRWTKHRVVGMSNSQPSLAAGILCGATKSAPVLAFAQQLGGSLNCFTDLPLLQRVYEIDSSPKASFGECVSALRLLERLSPDPDRGRAYKAQLIQRLASRLPHASAKDILLLRNLSTAGLSDATRIWASLAHWAASNRFVPGEDEDMLLALDDSLSPSAAVEPWRQSVLSGVVSASEASSAMLANAFWRWAVLRPSVLEVLADSLPVESQLESLLVDAAPRAVDLGGGNAMMVIAQRKCWLRLHGIAASTCLSPREAVTRQLSIDIAADNLSGIRASLRCTSPSESIEMALELAEPRVLLIVAERVADDPSLLRGVSFETAPAQVLWCHALTMNAEAWQGPSDPQGAFFTVLDNLLGGAEIRIDLIDGLSRSPLADLGQFPRRAAIWAQLPEQVRVKYLWATGTGWLKRALAGDVSAPEHQLEMAILSAIDMEGALSCASVNVGQIVRIIECLQNLKEPLFLKLLDEQALLRQPLVKSDAQALGRVILGRRWQTVADQLIKLAQQGRTDVKQALLECLPMVSYWCRFGLGLSLISAKEKWVILEGVAVDLYPTGPDEAGLWYRSGGKDADLNGFGSGRTRWHDALSQIQRGRGPSASCLLKEMHRDFPRSDQLRALLAKEMF